MFYAILRNGDATPMMFPGEVSTTAQTTTQLLYDLSSKPLDFIKKLTPVVNVKIVCLSETAKSRGPILNETCAVSQDLSGLAYPEVEKCSERMCCKPAFIVNLNIGWKAQLYYKS